MTKLKKLFARGLSLQTWDANEVARKINDGIGPAVYTHELVESTMCDEDVDLLTEWIEFWDDFYRQSDAGGDDVSPYAAPARATDLAGLPPAYINVGVLDLFVDEDITYAQRLMAAGVPTELHVYPGAFHGSPGLVPSSALSQRWAADELGALDRALNG